MNDIPEAFTLSSALSTYFPSFPISVLLIDDQMIVVEAVRRLLVDQSDITFHYCTDPSQAMNIALEVKPTVILQDLVMPEIDGLLLVKYFRANSVLHEVPIIVLSSKEEAEIKAEAFALGVNDYIVKLPDPVELIARIRYHSNSYIRLLERNAAFKQLQENQQILKDELAEAAFYVRSVLPEPLKPLENGVEVDWRFIPSTQLGGDAFGYHWLDENHFAVYLLDVCGHGVGAALHSISVINLLRSSNLAKADFYDPASVLTALNSAFPMEQHHDMFFTIWYGVYNRELKELLYAGGGHPPPLLMSGTSEQTTTFCELTSPGIAIGIDSDGCYENRKCLIGAYNTLFLFSDGVFEIWKVVGSMMTKEEFMEILREAAKKKEMDLDFIVHFIQKTQGKEGFADDFSLLQLVF